MLELILIGLFLSMKKDGGNYGQVAPTLVKQINNKSTTFFDSNDLNSRTKTNC